VTQEKPEYTHCDLCGRRYGFMNCRVTLWERGTRSDVCLRCACDKEAARRSPPPPGASPQNPSPAEKSETPEG
jgi:hypothetical protein